MLLNQHPSAVCARSINHLVHHVTQGDHFCGAQVSKLLGHVFLPPQEQSLQTQRSYFNWIKWPENNVQCHPVGSNTDDKAKHGQHPVSGVQDKRRHLQQAKQKAKIETRVHNKTELRLTHFAKYSNQEVFIIGELCDDHVFDVDQVFNIVTDVINQVVHDIRNGSPSTVIYSLAYH